MKLSLSDFRPDMIIWSADVTAGDLTRVIKSGVLPEGTVIKLDRLFFEINRKSLITDLQKAGYPVFCDAKIIEIPDKALAIADTYLSYQPFMLNIMGDACSTGLIDSDDEKKVDALKRFAEACEDAGTRSCVVTVLTSKSRELCIKEFNTEPIYQVLTYVEMAHETGITDIVCSPEEVEELRSRPEYNHLDLNTPGIRLPDSSSDDQARISTPIGALSAGANRLVIGRDLTRGEGDIVARVKQNYCKILSNIFDEPYEVVSATIGN